MELPLNAPLIGPLDKLGQNYSEILYTITKVAKEVALKQSETKIHLFVQTKLLEAAQTQHTCGIDCNEIYELVTLDKPILSGTKIIIDNFITNYYKVLRPLVKDGWINFFWDHPVNNISATLWVNKDGRVFSKP